MSRPPRHTHRNHRQQRPQYRSPPAPHTQRHKKRTSHRPVHSSPSHNIFFLIEKLYLFNQCWMCCKRNHLLMLQQIVFCWATYSSYPRCMFSQKCAGIFVTLSKATAMSEVTLLLPPMTAKMVFSGLKCAQQTCYLSIKNPFPCRYAEDVMVSTPICSHSKGSFLNSLPSFCNLVSSVIT